MGTLTVTICTDYFTFSYFTKDFPFSRSIVNHLRNVGDLFTINMVKVHTVVRILHTTVHTWGILFKFSNIHFDGVHTGFLRKPLLICVRLTVLVIVLTGVFPSTRLAVRLNLIFALAVVHVQSEGLFATVTLFHVYTLVENPPYCYGGLRTT